MTSPSFVAAWNLKFADVPVIRCGSALPPMDGDIAWLHDLRRALLHHQDRRALAPLPADYLYYRTLVHTGVVPSAMDWPDPAGAQLAAWRLGR